MGSILPLNDAKSIAVRLERLFHNLGTIGMACQAIDDSEQKDHLSVSISDMQGCVADMIADLNHIKLQNGIAGPLGGDNEIDDAVEGLRAFGRSI